MFSFGARKEYDGEITAKLNNDFKIDTEHAKNPNFPGILTYYAFLDEAWSNKGSPEEAATRMASMYYCGLVKNGNDVTER